MPSFGGHTLFFRVALAVLLLVAAGSALAAPPPSAADAAEARRQAAAAAEAMKAGDAASAAQKLERARELAPSADILHELARAYRLQGDNVKARNVLSALLAEYGTALAEKRRKQVESELAQVTARIAKLSVEVAEPAAMIEVDGRDVGSSPLAPLEIGMGAHSISVKKPGFVTVTRQVELGPGETKLTIVLERERATGKLLVTAPASEALTLFLNDQRAGSLPFEADVAPGQYTITATGTKTRAHPQQIRVETGQTTNVTLVVDDVPGTVQVKAGDAAATIYLDDRPLGLGEWQGEVPAGLHQLRIERPGYEPYLQSLQVLAGERLLIDQIPYSERESVAATPRRTEYAGFFANIALLGWFGSGSTNEVATDCAANATGGECSSTRPAGGGLGLRAGHSFGWFALEGVLVGGADVATTTADYGYGTSAALGDYYGVARNEDYAFVRYGFGGGGGVRVLSEGELVRVSGGLSGLLLWRTAQYVRDTRTTEGIPDAQTHTSETASYVSPGLMADVGVLIGGTPGVKFHVGLGLLVEFAPDTSVSGVNERLGGFDPSQRTPYGTPELDMSRGTQVAVGPFLAIQFGH